MLPTDAVGLARVMPRGEVSVGAAPYGADDARVAKVLAVREADLIQTRAAVQASRHDAQAVLDQAISAAVGADATLTRNEELCSRAVAAQATLWRFSPVALEDQPDVIVAVRNVDAARADLERAKLISPDPKWWL